MVRVFVNGTFDILHPGHMQLITFASNSGDYLLVGIDSDRRVSEKKGPTRPINNQEFRTAMMRHIKGVDEVVVFDSDEELTNMVRNYRPDVMIVGSDYKNERVIGSEYAASVVFFERDPKFSTTQIVESISHG